MTPDLYFRGVKLVSLRFELAPAMLRTNLAKHFLDFGEGCLLGNLVRLAMDVWGYVLSLLNPSQMPYIFVNAFQTLLRGTWYG